LANQVFTDIQQTGADILARKILLSGHVQGVGFRPFIYRLANEYHLTGWVRNCVGIVEIHVQGNSQSIKNFIDDIFAKKPPLAKPVLESEQQVAISEFENFCIKNSQSVGKANIQVPADLYLCDDCLAELNTLADRRYRYPFINCTQCGPRYTLIRHLPYDRPNTTMAEFELCAQCRSEYEDSDNRRFHAEPVGCPACGPELSFHCDKEVNNGNEVSLQKAIEQLLLGNIIAVKGVGGYHLICDASNNQAVARLRNKKQRLDKPLAIMFPAPAETPFIYAEQSTVLTDSDKAFLLQPARSILLVEKKAFSNLSELIAPGLNEVGIMLPYSPLHHLLLNDFAAPLVATSANISGEPVLTDNQEIEKRLAHVADAFLHHNRPIERPADDPVYRIIADKSRPVRLGRGIAPLELDLGFELKQPVLAVGAHMKNTIALGWGHRVVVSAHIGEMDSARSLEVFENTITDLQTLYGVKIETIICDAHPGYTSSRWAKRQSLPVRQIYHHHAHASSAYYECETDKPVISFTWDGVGYGEDGTFWGGEAFIGIPGGWQRVASMRPFNLAGGDRAGREPWRSAASVCWETGQAFDAMPVEPLLYQAWQKKINAAETSSVGRLFDAVAALTGVCTTASYEGQGPMQFEALCRTTGNDFIALELENKNNLWQTDWQALVSAMQKTDLSVAERAALFHQSMAQVILQQAITIRDQYAINVVTLSGGVFQNRVLTESAMQLLTGNDFEVHLPELIPVNDAGISFGQIMEYGYKK